MAGAAKKKDDKDIPIGRLAQSIVHPLIGVHGLRRALDIGARVHEQLIAEVKSQVKRHPDEWDNRTKSLVGMGELVQDVPAPPPPPAPPVI